MDSQCAIEDFDPAILGWAVGARWFNSIPKLIQHDSSEVRAARKFSALVGADAAVTSSKLCEESAKYVDWGFFRFC